MITATAWQSTGERVGKIAGDLIRSLQRGYLRDESYAVSARARLARGAGKDFGRTPDLWGLVDTGPLYEDPSEGGRPLTEKELDRAENAVHVAITLWALHQQSRGDGMHRNNASGYATGLGAAVRRLMSKDNIDEAVLKRLVRAGNAPDLHSLAQRLREIVLLLRPKGLELDYALLAHQLYRWQAPGGRDAVRRQWGRSFQLFRFRDGNAAAIPTQHTDGNDATANDKDAS